MARFAEAVISTTSSIPEATAPSMMYWSTGLSTMGSISFGTAFDAGRKRVPRPAAGITALRTRVTDEQLLFRSISAPRQQARAGSRPRTPARRRAGVPADAPHALLWWRDRTRSL